MNGQEITTVMEVTQSFCDIINAKTILINGKSNFI